MPFKRKCLSPINGILEPNILDQRTWNGAANYCERRWNSTLLSVPFVGGNAIRELKARGIFVEDQKVWLGLYKPQVIVTSFHVCIEEIKMRNRSFYEIW